MRTFDIYLMKEEIIQLYLGREGLLFRLFLEYQNEQDPEKKEILNRQIAFITKPLDVLALRRSLLTKYFDEISNNKWLITQKGGSEAILTFANNSLTLESIGNFSAETTIFEILRRSFANFFAIDYQNECGAWLTPHKKHNFYQRKLVQ